MRPEDFNRRRDLACFVFSLSFAGLVVLARSMNPIPSRTRTLNSSAPMVLWLKPWESRSLPGLPRTRKLLFRCYEYEKRRFPPGGGVFCCHFCRSGLAARAIFAHDCRAYCPRGSGRQAASLRTSSSSLPVHFKIRTQSCLTTKVATPKGD